MSSGWGWGIGPGPASPPGRRDFVSSHAGAQRGFAVRGGGTGHPLARARAGRRPGLPSRPTSAAPGFHHTCGGAGRAGSRRRGSRSRKGGGASIRWKKKRQRPSLSTNAPLLVRAPRVGVAARAPPGRPRRPGLWVTDQTLVGTHRPWGPGRRRGGPPFSMASVFFLGAGVALPDSFFFLLAPSWRRTPGRTSGRPWSRPGGRRPRRSGGRGWRTWCGLCVGGVGVGREELGQTEVWGLFHFRSQRRTGKDFLSLYHRGATSPPLSLTAGTAPAGT